MDFANKCQRQYETCLRQCGGLGAGETRTRTVPAGPVTIELAIARFERSQAISVATLWRERYTPRSLDTHRAVASGLRRNTVDRAPAEQLSASSARERKTAGHGAAGRAIPGDSAKLPFVSHPSAGERPNLRGDGGTHIEPCPRGAPAISDQNLPGGRRPRARRMRLGPRHVPEPTRRRGCPGRLDRIKLRLSDRHAAACCGRHL